MYQVLKTVQFTIKAIEKKMGSEGLVHKSTLDFLLHERESSLHPLQIPTLSHLFRENHKKSGAISKCMGPQMYGTFSKTLNNLLLYTDIGFESFSRVFLTLQSPKLYDLLNTSSKHKVGGFFFPPK